MRKNRERDGRRRRRGEQIAFKRKEREALVSICFSLWDEQCRVKCWSREFQKRRQQVHSGVKNTLLENGQRYEEHSTQRSGTDGGRDVEKLGFFMRCHRRIL